jgi:hypothetical protein
MTKARDLANAADVLDDVSATELSYVNGVTSDIQTQLDAKVAKSLVDAKGDLLVGTANDTVGRLAVASTAGYLLTVDSGETTGLKWAAPAGGGKVLQVVSATTTTNTSIATTTLTDTTITATITPTSATSKILILITAQVYYSRVSTIIGLNGKLLRGATELYSWNPNRLQYLEVGGSTEVATMTTPSISYLDNPATTSSTTYKLQSALSTTANSAGSSWQYNGAPSTITLLEIGA